MRRVFIAAAAACVIGSCSSAPPTSLSGDWSGSWSSLQMNALTPSGMISMSLMQSGTNVTGSGTVTPYGSGTVMGTYTPATGKLSGKMTAAIGSVTFDGTAGGTTISGTYISSAGDNGTFSISKK